VSGVPVTQGLYRGMRMSPVWNGVAWAGLVILCVAVGGSVVRGGLLPTAVLGMVVGGAFFFFVGRLGFASLLFWAAVSPLLYPWLRVPSGRPLITFDRLWIISMVACLLFTHRERAASKETRFLTLCIAWLVVAWGVRAYTTSGSHLSNVANWIDAGVLPLVVFAVTLRFATTLERCIKLAGAMAIGGTALAVVGIAGRIVGYDLAIRAGGTVRFDHQVGAVRIAGTYPVPEVFALVLVVCLAATLYWTLVRGRPSYALGATAAVLQAIAIAFTLFRAAWLAALIVVVAALGIRPGRYARTILGVGLLGVLLIGGYSQLRQSSTFQERIQNVQNIQGRLATYKEGLQIFEQHPLAGVGTGQFAKAQLGVSTTSYAGVRAVTSPHSSYVGTLAEQGLLGFVPLLAVTFAVGRLLRSYRRRASSSQDVLLAVCVAGAALGYLVMSLTLTMLPYGPPNAAFLLLVALAAARLDAEPEELVPT